MWITCSSDRRTNAARDQVTAAGADRANESKRSTAFYTGDLQGGRLASVAGAVCFSKFLLTKDRRDHPISRAVADACRNKEAEEHRKEPGKVFSVHEVHDANGGGAHGYEIPERHDRAADFVGSRYAAW